MAIRPNSFFVLCTQNHPPKASLRRIAAIPQHPLVEVEEELEEREDEGDTGDTALTDSLPPKSSSDGSSDSDGCFSDYEDDLQQGLDEEEVKTKKLSSNYHEHFFP
jgi:hypothetical protein